jgi:hypothetical protein
MYERIICRFFREGWIIQPNKFVVDRTGSHPRNLLTSVFGEAMKKNNPKKVVMPYKIEDTSALVLQPQSKLYMKRKLEKQYRKGCTRSSC